MQRRAARGSAIATPRRESDLPRIVSGLKDGITTGQPLTALFDNADTHSADYGFLPDRPRPGHADYPAWVRSAGFDDLRGSGHHSGRLTLPYAFAGGVALQLLSREGVRVGAHVLSIASERDDALDPLCPDMDALSRCHAQPVPTLDPEAGSRMYAAIMEARGLTLEEYIAWLREFPYESCRYQEKNAIVSFLPGASDGPTILKRDSDLPCTISGNNVDGFIITEWRRAHG